MFGDKLVEIPEAGSRVIVDSESGILDAPVTASRSKQAVLAVRQRNPTFGDLNFLYYHSDAIRLGADSGLGIQAGDPTDAPE